MTLSVPQLTKDGRVIFNSKSTLPALVHPTMVLYVYWEEGNFPPTCDTCLTWQHIPMVGMDKEANLELKQQIQNDILKYGKVVDFEPTNILVATWRDVPPYPAEIYSGHQVRYVQANARHWAIVGSMLGQRRRRWTNIEPTMAEWRVFVRIDSFICFLHGNIVNKTNHLYMK